MTRRTPVPRLGQGQPGTSSSADTDNDKGAALAPWNLMIDLGRHQVAFSSEAASLMFRGSEAIRRIQWLAAHEALLRHHAALQKLQERQTSGDPGDLLAEQAALLRFELEQASHYCEQLSLAALQTQREVLGCASRLFAGEAANNMRSAVQVFWPHAPAAPGSDAAQTGS